MIAKLSWGRIRLPATAVGFLLLIASLLTDLVPFWLGIAAFLAALALYLRLGWPRRRQPVTVTAPVHGRWSALNSPADQVPSHGLHAYGQTYAIDLVRAVDGDGERRIHWWPPARRPQEFPAFGEEVRAPADGIVIRVRDSERDHWSRDSWPGLAYLVAEGAVRELAGPSRILGNHVVIEIGQGVYAVLAHLQRRSVRVHPGDAVSSGELVARCGNSGNSSEPHLHFQLMDHPRLRLADGVPFAFDRFESGGRAGAGVPGKEAPVRF